MYAGPATDLVQVSDARSLAAQVFASMAGQSICASEEFKQFLWDEADLVDPSMIVVLSPTAGKVVGVARLVVRELYRSDQSFSCAGFSSICIAPEWRGKGLSAQLMNAATKQAIELNCDIALLFARRAVDYYYNRFDFWGLSNYDRLQIHRDQLNNSDLDVVSFLSMTEMDVKKISSWHKRCYGNTFGSMRRSSIFWKYLLKKLPSQGFVCECVYVQGSACGYVIRSGATIHEIAFDEGVDIVSVLAMLPVGEQEALEIEIGRDHPLVQQLVDLDFRLSSRQCGYGGHMIKVLNVDSVASRLKDRLENDADEYGLSPKSESQDGIGLEWDGKDVVVKVDVMLGKLGFEATAKLLGINVLTRSSSVLDSAMNFNVSLPDHF